MKSNLILKLFLAFTFILLIQVTVFSQVIPPDPPKPDVPITGIEILIGAGALIGARKIMRLRSKK